VIYTTVVSPTTPAVLTAIPTGTATDYPPYATVTYCGDGIVQYIEQCDAGGLNGTINSFCSTTCQIASRSTCGNSTIQTGEECDDGNARSGDGCSSLCLRESGRCGDGIVQTALGEQCDDGNRNPGDDCDNACQWVPLEDCGDAVLNAATEQCDNGAEQNSYAPNSWCRSNCTWQRCGDGVLDDFIEECDDGNNLDNDGCSSVCIVDHAGAPPLTGDLGATSGETAGDIVFEQVPTPAQTPTGPGLLIFLASGAAAGIGIARRRFRK